MVPHNSDDLTKLLEIAESKKVEEPKTNPEIDLFIKELQIKSGNKRIPTSIIYLEYYYWKKTHHISRQKFFNYFKTKFKKTTTDHGVGYLLDDKPFDISPVGFFRARALMRKEREKVKK